MITKFLKQSGSRLVLLFLGYAQDERPFAHLKDEMAGDTALAVVYGYDGEEMSLPPFAYESVRVVAWSMGVMMAPRLLSGLDLSYERRCAVNGSLEGIDAQYGIPPEIWDRTIDELDGPHAENFIRLMCRTPALIKEYLALRPERSLESLRSELCFLREAAKERGAVTRDFYDEALVSKKDLIMPPRAVQASFERCGLPCTMVSEPHYAPEAIRALVTAPFER